MANRSQDRQSDMLERIAVAAEMMLDLQLNPAAAKVDPHWLEQYNALDEAGKSEYGHDPRAFAREHQAEADFAKLPPAEQAQYSHNAEVWRRAMVVKAEHERARKAEAERVKIAQDKAKADAAEADKKHLAEIQARQSGHTEPPKVEALEKPLMK